MPLRLLKTQAALEGHVEAEAAETLLHWLQAHPQGTVHLGRCESLHTAVLQTLLAFKPSLKAPPPDARMSALLSPLERKP